MTVGGPRPWQGGNERDDSKAWERAGWTAPERARINHSESGLPRSEPASTCGGWVAFCDECSGVVVEDYSSGETVCGRCGLVVEVPAFERNNSRVPWEIDDGKQDKKERSLGLLDRRIELIFRSIGRPDRTIDLNFGGKYALLRDRYNEIFSPPINSDDARNSYNRFVKRQNAIIDREAGRIVSEIISDNDHKRLSSEMFNAGNGYQESIFPGKFIYTGTTRSMIKNISLSQLTHFNEKNRERYRKQLVRDMIFRPKAPSIISRNYIAYDGKSHKIIIKIEGARIYYLDESDPSLETFFLSFAIKHDLLKLHKDPEARRQAIDDFRRKYQSRHKFHRQQYYDATPYLLELQKEIPNLQISPLHSDL